jgi:hypothetical protein
MDCRTTSDTYAQELRDVIRRLLADVDWKDVQFREDCKWAPFGLVAAALVWAWSAKGTLKERFTQAHRFARGLGRSLAPDKTSYQAFLKMLVRWTVPLMGCVMLTFRVLMERKFPKEFRFAGFLILAADGSKLKLTRTQSNELRYSPATRGKKGKKRRQTSRAQETSSQHPSPSPTGQGQEIGLPANRSDAAFPCAAATSLGLATWPLRHQRTRTTSADGS